MRIRAQKSVLLDFTSIWTFDRKAVCFCVFCRCGYATLHDVKDKTQEDRMESFFLSETSKYLYLVSITSKLSPSVGVGRLVN